MRRISHEAILQRLARTLSASTWRWREIYLQDAVFIHINKTGGTSISRALGLRGGHWTALEKRAELGEAVWQRKYSFAFVRNPWDRVVSQYHWRRSINQTELKTHPIEFNTWLTCVYRDRTPKYYDDPKMFMPQLDWISDSDGRFLVNFVGRFENLEHDFQAVCQHLGANIKLAHLNQTEHAPYRDYFSAESIALIRAWFRKDIEYFGYTF